MPEDEYRSFMAFSSRSPECAARRSADLRNGAPPLCARFRRWCRRGGTLGSHESSLPCCSPRDGARALQRYSAVRREAGSWMVFRPLKTTKDHSGRVRNAYLGTADLLQQSCRRGSRISPGRRGGCLGREPLGTCSVDGAANFANVRFSRARTAAKGVRRDKAALSSGCKAHPATAPAGRFYGSCQGLREPFRVEVSLVGVDGPGGTRDAPSEDDQGCSGG